PPVGPASRAGPGCRSARGTYHPAGPGCRSARGTYLDLLSPMRTFRIALTGDFLDENGAPAYGDAGLSLLEGVPFIRPPFLTEHAPRRDDPDYWQRFYSMEVRPGHLAGVDGLVVLRPWVKRATFAHGAGDLVVIGRSGAGYDKIDVAACTDNDVALFNAPMA